MATGPGRKAIDELSMTERDPELVRLLVHEIERHLAVLDAGQIDRVEAIRTVQTVKGSAGLAGEQELFEALDRLDRRLRDGDEGALKEAASLLRSTGRRLAEGKTAFDSHWPVPPDHLAEGPIHAGVRPAYLAEMRDRLAEIDEALAADEGVVEAARTIYRHVHTMKGAASSVGDDVMTWFCHGLEDRIKGADSADAAAQAVHETSKWRGVLGGLLDEPAGTLATLRARGRPSPHLHSLTQGPASNRTLESEPPRAPVDDANATIRVQAAHVDRLLQRFDMIDRVREGVAASAGMARDAATAARGVRASLVEALRLIGPPRPWGAPAAALRRVEDSSAGLGALGNALDDTAGRLHGAEHALRDGAADAKKDLSTMRRTAAGRLFARLTTAIESEARRTGRSVIVRTRGAEESIDRRVAENLVDPCLQLVRNAVAHGIEPPLLRSALGKATNGTITLVARKSSSRLAVTIEDDGAGVDVAEVRARAVASGVVSSDIAGVADDDTLLSLLFFPGFSTRESTDLLAGRGIGLDIARNSIHKMGGVIRLSSRAGEGFSARIEVPIDTGLATVLWVVVGDDELALPATSARRVRKSEPPESARVPHLLACLGAAADEPARFLVDLETGEEDANQPVVSVGVDGIGRTEELLVRPLGALASSVGPYAGAIVRGDGSLRLAIDAWAIAPRARALGRRASTRAPEATASARSKP
jgi:two-component system chemotaxis sensor kinase CheA